MSKPDALPTPARRRNLLVLTWVSMLLVAAALWWFGNGSDGPTGTGPAPMAADAPSPRSAAFAADADADPMPAVERQAPGDDFERRHGTKRHDPGLVRVRVVRDGHVPVADAIVTSLPPHFDWARLDPDTARRHARAVSIQDRLEIVGTSTRTDAEGIALVPRPTQWPEVIARAPGLFGWCEVEGPEPDEGFVLRLAADETLRVRVLDAAQVPAADLKLGLESTDLATGAVSLVPVATTDADGLAVVQHLQLLRSAEGVAAASNARIVAFAPGLTGVGVAFDLAKTPQHVLELQLPATGSLRVELAERDGSLLRGETVQLDPIGGTECWFFAEAPDGTAFFPVVGLGARFRARSPQRSAWLDGSGPGPRHPGETAVLRLQLPGSALSLHGRAIGANGRVLGSGSLAVSGAPGTDIDERVRIDAEGRFVVLLGARAQGAPLQLDLRRWSTAGTDAMQFRGEQARVVLAPEAEGKLHLGDVVFERAPLLATGRLVGVEPLPSIAVRVVRFAASGEWSDATAVGVDVHADGTFEVLGNLRHDPPLRHLLQFSASGCSKVAPIELRGGERDLVVTLRRGASLDARVLVDASVLQHPEVLVFELRTGDDTDYGPAEAEPEVDGARLRLRIGELQAGPAALRIRLAGSPDALVVFDDLQLGGDELLRDPRLSAIDLLQVRAVRLRLVDGRGAPHAVGGSWLPARTDRRDDYLLGLESGCVWIGCVDSFDVLLFGEGLFPVRAQGAARDLDVATEAQPLVNLHFDGLPAPLPEVAFRVRVEPSPDGLAERFAADFGQAELRSFWCAADGTAAVRLPEPGATRLRLECVLLRDPPQRSAEVLVENTPLSRQGVHRVPVTPEALQRAMQELGLPR